MIHSLLQRSTLDPFASYDDTRLWDALRRSSLMNDERLSSDMETDIEDDNGKLTLDTIVEPEGANLSLGQRSLLSLARALVKDSRIVILDEATSVLPLYLLQGITDCYSVHQ